MISSNPYAPSELPAVPARPVWRVIRVALLAVFCTAVFLAGYVSGYSYRIWEEYNPDSHWRTRERIREGSLPREAEDAIRHLERHGPSIPPAES